MTPPPKQEATWQEKNTLTSSGTYKKVYKINMKPHTNITNEITGAYYEEKKAPLLNIIFVTLAVIVTCLVLADLIVGAENVTNTLADLVVKVRN